VKLVVTGALGHIGSRFIRSLEPGDFTEVVLLDNLRTQRFASLFDLPAGIPYRFIEADVLTANLEEIFAGAFAVLHLAAVTESANSHQLREEIERVNGEGSARVARACAAAGARLLFPSSTSVYGTSRAVVDEACGPEDLNPATPYAAGKLDSVRLFASLAGGARGLRFSVLRLGTIFGVSPGMRFHTAVNRFAWQACAGEPLSVWTTAREQVRPYLDVGDAAAAFRFFLARDLFRSGTYNVVTVNTTVSAVVNILRAEIPDLTVRTVDAAAMSADSFSVSDAKLRAEGFKPAGSLENGIRETVTRLRHIRTASSE
jgi:UDP-glucose 4-epimerase